METNQLPQMNMDTSETGCCPAFDPAGWDGQTIVFKDKLFAKDKTINFLHMPLNMGSVMNRMYKKVMAADAYPKDYYLLLSHDQSPWRGVHYQAVTKEVPGMETERLSGTYLTKVFEGPYKNAGKWVKEAEEYVKSQGKELKKLYFFYTTCPKCLKHYGKNYVVAFAQV